MIEPVKEAIDIVGLEQQVEEDNANNTPGSTQETVATISLALLVIAKRLDRVAYSLEGIESFLRRTP